MSHRKFIVLLFWKLEVYIKVSSWPSFWNWWENSSLPLPKLLVVSQYSLTFIVDTSLFSIFTRPFLVCLHINFPLWMVTMVNNVVCLKFAKKVNLKTSHKKKEMYLFEGMDVNWIYCDNHFAVYLHLSNHFTV